MPLWLRCPHCQKQLQAADDCWGKVLRCGGCQQLFRVGKPAPATSADPLPAVPEQLVREEIPRQPPSQSAVPAPPHSPPEAAADVPRASEATLASPTRRPSRALLIGGIVGVLISLLSAGAIALIVFSSKASRAPDAAKAPNEPVAVHVQDPRAEQSADPKPANPKNDPQDKLPNTAPKENEERRGPGALSAKLLRDLKAATVFVKVEGSGFNGSGSGFVAKVEGDIGYVVTNYHVVNPKFEIILPNLRRPPAPRAPNRRRPPAPRGPIFLPPQHVLVTVRDAVYTTVFYSGTKNEQSATAELVRFDPDHDLALLKVAGLRNLPRPIDLKQTDKLVETMPVYVFGFPFGKILATNKGHPAITVGKGAVSSIRLDEHDAVAYVQIDGALNPGNSGGPVVDAEGRLLGIAVATIRGSSGIGLAIPVKPLTELLEGKGTVPGNDTIVKRPEDKNPKRENNAPIVKRPEDKNPKGENPAAVPPASFRVSPGFIYGPTRDGVRQWTLDLKVVAEQHIPGVTGMVGAAISADGLFLTCAFRERQVERAGNHLLALGPDGDIVYDLFLTGSAMNAGSGIAVDASGRIYVASAEGVHEVASDFSGQRLLPVKFGRAAGIAVGAKGELFIADQSNNRIAVLDQERKLVRFIPTGPTPSGVAFGPDGHLYYVDTPHRSAVGYLSRFVRVDLKKDDAQMVVKRGLAYLNSIAFAEDGSYYLNGSGMSHYSATGEMLGNVGHNARVDAVTIFSPNKIVKRKERTKTYADPQPQQWTLAPEGGAEITCLSFSPDGQWLATGSTDRVIRIWDVAKGVERSRFVHEGQIDSVLFSPSGRQLALNEGMRILELPDAGPPVQRLSEGNGSKIAFSLDEKLIARVSGLCVRISEQGVPGLRELVGFEAPILCLAFSPDGRTLATGGADHVVKLWNVQTKELRATFTGHQDHVTDLAFAPDGRTLASASNDKTVRLWDLTTLQLRATLSGHAGGVLSVAFAPDSRTLVSCGANGLVCRWLNRVDKQIPAVEIVDQPSAIRAAAFSPRRKLVATLAAGVVKFALVPRDGASPPDAAKFQALLNRKNALTIRVGGLLRGPVVFSPKGDTLFTTNADSTTTHRTPRIRTWETMTGRPKDTMEGSAPFVLTPDGRTMLFAEPQSMRLRNLRTGELLRDELKFQYRPATGEMALSPDGETVLIAQGKTLNVYDLPIRQLKKTWDHFDGQIRHVAFAPDGRTFAVALEPQRPERPVLLCDTGTGMVRAKCLGHRLGVRSMAFTPDSKRLVTGGMDYTIRLWDAVTGKEIALLGNHEAPYGEVVALSVHRAGKILASAGGDGVLNLWDLDQKKKLLTLRPHPRRNPLVGAAFSADGKILAACANYDYVTLWDVESLLRDAPPLLAPPTDPTATLVVERKGKFGNYSRVLGLAADGKPRWQFDAGGLVTDAHMIGADRVLYAVSSHPLLIEKDLSGKTVWSKQVTGDHGSNIIRSVQRLPNGNTLCAFDYRLVEIDPSGDEIVIYQRQRIGGDAITDMRVLPNGNIGLVTNDGLYRLLDAGGHELKNVRIIPRLVFSGGKLDVLPSGGVLVTDWNKNKVVEFDAEGKWVWEANVKSPTSVSRLSNGNTLVTSQEDCCAVELDQTGKEVWRYQGKGHVLLARRLSVPGLLEQQDNVPRILRRVTFQGHLEAPGAVAFARDGNALMTVASQITIWRTSDLRELDAAPLIGRGTLVALGYTPNLQTICTLDNKGYIHLYHWNSPQPAENFALPLARGKVLAAAACSPDGKRMAGSFLNERTIEIWDIAEKKLLHKLPEQAHHVMTFAFSPDGKLLVSTGGDSKVKFWDVASGREIASLTPEPIEGAKVVELGASTFSPDGKTLAMRGENACIRLWDIEKRAVRAVVRPPADPCCLAFSPDSRLLAAGMRDGMIHVWDVATGTRHGSLPIEERREIRAVAFSPDSSKLTVSCGQELQLWDLRRSLVPTISKTP